MELKRFTNEEIADTYKTCGLDFDGTLTQGGYPEIGEPQAHAKQLVERLREEFKVILYTCRTAPVLLKRRGMTLSMVVAEIEEWLEEHDIEVDGITTMPKPLFDRYIGDEAFNDMMACRMLKIEVDLDEDGSGGEGTGDHQPASKREEVDADGRDEAGD